MPHRHRGGSSWRLRRTRWQWGAAVPATGAYCAEFMRNDTLNPEREASTWLADCRRRYSEGRHVHFRVQRPCVCSELEEAALEAPEALAPQCIAPVAA